MKNSISIILILLLFSSAQDQNEQDPMEIIIHQAPVREEIISSESRNISPFQQDVEESSASESVATKSFQNGDVEHVMREEDIVPERNDHELPFDNGHSFEFIELQEPSANQQAEPKEEEKVPLESNKSEDSIPSFSEWTKLQLAQRKESIINNIKNKTSPVEGKNFASPDCGTKVINSNPESQNPSGVISSSHDEYMLNRCTTNVWFILELCEPLTIETVSIGNLELFSSNPHEIELGVSDRYPTRDWSVIGPYFAPDSRNMHLFHLPTNNSTFGKYLRVIVKSHHGNEHYCPLSLIKVYGRSEYEALESETTHGEDMEMDAPGIIEEEMNDDKPVQKSVIGTATAAVMDMVKKAADALVSTKVVEEAKPSLPHSPESSSNSSTCVTLTLCLQESEFKAAILKTLSCQSKDLEWLQKKMSWCGWDYCHRFLETHCIGSPWMPEGLFIAIYGPTIIETFCHYKNPISVCDPVRTSEDMVEVFRIGNELANESMDISQPRVSSEGGGNGVETDTSAGTDALNVNSGNVSRQPTDQPNFHLPTLPPPIEEPAQKESVFVRLSNRIKNLERNQSLSSGYLEELSQRFKKQNEEIHNSHEQFRRTLNESLTKCTLVEQSLRYEVRKLNRNIDSLRELIWRVELQRSGLFLLSLLQIICTCIFWWSGKEKRQSQTCRAQCSTSATGLIPLEAKILQMKNQRKRSCSQPPRQKKKKKRKEMQGGGSETKKVENAPKDVEISMSLSSSSTPLRLPPPFEFKSSPIFNTPRIPSPNSCLLPTTRQAAGMKPGVSSSDISETSFGSTKSKTKKSKFKSFFFGK